MRFHSAYVQVQIEKNGELFDKNNFPIFFNSISSVKADVRMIEIMDIEITLTPSFRDALLILQSGLIGFGKTDKKPDLSNGDVSPTSIGASGNASVPSTTNKDPLKSALEGMATMYVKFLRPGESLSEGAFETPWYVGAVTQPDVQVTNSEITISLKGYAYGIFFGGPKYLVKITEDTTVLSLVEDAAALLDHKVIFDGLDSETEEILDNTKLSIQPRQETPFDTIKWALSQVGCVFSIGVNPLEGEEKDKKGNAILIRKLSALHNQQSKYTLVQWRQLDRESLPPQIPCTSFVIESGRSLFFNGFSFGAYRLGDDPFAKEVIPATAVKPRPFAETDTNNTTTLEADEGATSKMGYFTPIHGSTEQEKNATTNTVKSEIESQLSNFQKFAIEIPGVPNLAPMDMVDLMVGDIDEFSGKIMVTGITHVWDSNGWITNIEGRKTGGLKKE